MMKNGNGPRTATASESATDARTFQPPETSETTAAYTRSDVRIPSGTDTLDAWVYTPTGPTREHSAIVMAHGLGCVKAMGLDNYAAAFAQAGYVVVVFDYRHFAASSGQPRQLLSIRRELDDYAAALAWTRALPTVAARRVGVFGTSFSGGHVLKVAAADPQVAAVISQCPFTNGLASTTTIGPLAIAGVGLLASRDIAAATLRRSPALIPLAGRRRKVALMNAPDVWDGIHALIPSDTDWVNGVCARVALQIPLYFPGRAAARVQAPICFAVCDQDSVAPPGPTVRYASKAPRGETNHFPMGHFDIYLGQPLADALVIYLEFLGRVLPA